MSTMPPILYGLPITEIETYFTLPRASTPLSDVDPADATHVSLSTLFELFFLYLLSDSSALQVHVSTTQSWYTAAISVQEYFVEFTSTQSVCLLLLVAYYSYFMQMNVLMNACDL